MDRAGKRLLSPLKQKNEHSIKKVKTISNELNLQSKKVEVKTSCEIVENNFDFLLDDDDFDLDQICAIKKPVMESFDLTLWQRCIVEKIERSEKNFQLILHVRKDDCSCKENLTTYNLTKCHLQGQWSHIRIDVGALVSLQAVWDSQLSAYKIDNDNGFCVTNPDTLISGTSVVGSLFCRRKAVLQERFRGIDSGNKVMLIGSIVHELVQIVLSKNLKTYDQIDKKAKELLETPSMAYTFYESLVTREEIMSEVQKFLPNIVSFIREYVEGQESSELNKDDFHGIITEIEDIEENVWVPQLGLKGKVDVTVGVKRRHKQPFSVAEKNPIPLELKTGRASFSMEHKGQLILYQMMLSAIGRETKSGLLLYLRDGIMREIQGTRNEQRDLIFLRNDFSNYISLPTPASQRTESHENNSNFSIEMGKYTQPFELPEPISHHSACSTCAYATICCTFAKTDPQLTLRDSHPLQKVTNTVTKHLKPEDYEYFIHWCRLLTLEEQETKKSYNLRSLWVENPERRQEVGRAIIGLRLAACKMMDDNTRFLHTFNVSEEESNERVGIVLSGFGLGEYVIVSSTKRLAIASGHVYDTSKFTISLSLERDLRKHYAGQEFIIDKYESQSGNVFNFTNLGLLLDESETSARMRQIIVHREQPTFKPILPKIIATVGGKILKSLNTVQRKAVIKALTTDSFMLIKGLPGTGKTQTLVAIVRLLHLIGKTVLITSHTHSAVDNLLLRLQSYELPILRLGSETRINPQLKEYSQSEILKDCRTETEIAAQLAKYSIVGVTCLGTSHPLFLHRKFDYCIVDEATQVQQCTVLLPIYFSEKFILVGDPDQLPPIIRSREARQQGADESLFHRLDTEHATSVLTLQYRMNKTITKFANELTYAGALQCGSDDIKMSSIKLRTSVGGKAQEKWVQRALQTHIDQSVFFLDTLDCAERSSEFATENHSTACAAIENTFAEVFPTVSNENDIEDLVTVSPSKRRNTTTKRLSKYTNYCEAVVIFYLVKNLLVGNYDPNRIGIIAPFRAQVELLNKLIGKLNLHYESQEPKINFNAIEVNTVDQYQGRDKDIIFYSCTKTGAPNNYNGKNFDDRHRESEILEDKRRLTVAITRSKYKLIIVGDAVCLQQYTPFASMLKHIPGYCKLKLQDGKLDFQWSTLLEEIAQVLSSC